MQKQMDHNQYPKSLKSKSDDQLRFIAKDAQEAAATNPTGENAGYYLDEALYAASELNRRQIRRNAA